MRVMFFRRFCVQVFRLIFYFFLVCSILFYIKLLFYVGDVGFSRLYCSFVLLVQFFLVLFLSLFSIFEYFSIVSLFHYFVYLLFLLLY